ncbi:MAG: nuclear transport factor 2 family protein [Gammaproteobacteria bacterium]|nr:nuclear transport factor 2 family protein [Gammaproteobacteria bacterium]
MFLFRLRHASPGLALALVLTGCSGGGAISPEQLNASYERALARTESSAAVLADPRVATARLERFFGDMSRDSLPTLAAATYAADAYFNDTLTALEGSAAIADYFAGTLDQVRTLRVEFLDLAHDDVDYFLRWRMTVESDRLNDGRPMVSYGMTHFRFDPQGLVLVHKDFWDAGTGLYEYLPGIGGVLRRVRASVENPQ